MAYKDKDKKRATQNAWNSANREKANAYKKQYFEKIDAVIAEAKSGGCVRCEEEHPACLVFHHIDASTKLATVAQLRRLSLPKIKEEIAKCEVLCANCHYKEHYSR